MSRTRLHWVLAAVLAVAVALPALAAPGSKKKDPFTHFGEVTEDAEHLTGFFDVYRKRDDVLLEIPLDRLGEEFLLVQNLSRGIGSNYMLGGLPIGSYAAQLLRFERHGDRIFLYQANPRFTAEAGSEMANAVDLSHGETVLMTFKVMSERKEGDEVGVVPEPPKDKKKKKDDAEDGDGEDDAEDGDGEDDGEDDDSVDPENDEPSDTDDDAGDDGDSDDEADMAAAEESDDDAEEEAEEPEKPVVSVVIDWTDFLMADVPNLSQELNQAFKTGFKLDKSRSRVAETNVFPDNAEFEVDLVFSSSGKKTIPGLQDSRYLPLGVHYSFARLPDEPMTPRLADDRVGYFLTAHKNYSHDEDINFWVRYCNRWRLEKKNPNREMSEPIEPITYYMENTIPQEYRKYVKEGVEMWQKAFEAAGFKNAIIAVDQPDDPDWSAEDMRYASLRWITSHQQSFGAIGPSRVDPRTGEILDADILFEASMVRGFRNSWRRMVGDIATGADGELIFPWELALKAEEEAMMAALENPDALNAPGVFCSLGHGFVESGGLLQAALAVRGEILPGDPVPMEYVGEALRWVVAHEVGHTLGLRHNFKSSRSVPFDKLHDKAYIKENGLYGSVMDYPTVNLASSGKQGYYYSPTVGTYDVWAIRYGYTEVKGARDSEDEMEALAAIAAENTDPLHAYGTDEDSYLPGAVDPRTNIFDLSEDPLAWAEDRSSLISGMWGELDDRTVGEGQPWAQLTWGYMSMMGQYNRSMYNVAKYIGARHQSRAHRGDPNAPLPYTAVDPEEQRRALSILAEKCFSERPFDMPADFYDKITPSNFNHWGTSVSFGARRDFPFHAAVLSVQRSALRKIMNPYTFAKVVDAELGQEDPFTLVELFGTLNASVFSEIGVNGYGQPASTEGAGGATGGVEDIDGIRRGLQRLYVDTLIDVSLNQGSGALADARSVARMSLVDIHEHMESALDSGSLDGYTRAHLLDSSKLIAKALESGYESELMQKK